MTEYKWYASRDEEYCTVGPCDTREQAIAEAIDDCMGEYEADDGSYRLSFYIMEAKNEPLKLSDWIDVDRMLEDADEKVGDSDRVAYEYDEPPYFEFDGKLYKDLEARIKKACDDWQTEHNLVFRVTTFSHVRGTEHINVEAPKNE